MPVNLKKGQKVNLTKDSGVKLRDVIVGLGWDENEQPRKKGVLEGFFGGKKQVKVNFDCDAMAFLLNENGQLERARDTVFFNNLSHDSGCVRHLGDNRTGGGGEKEDDEQILINLEDLPEKYSRIVIVVTIYKAQERKQHFGMIKNAFIRLTDQKTGKELCVYNLSEKYPEMTSLIFGELSRGNGEWKFNALGQPLKEWSIVDLSARYGLGAAAWKQ